MATKQPSKPTPLTTTSGTNNAKTMYVIFGIIAIGLIFLIMWFAYLLWQPQDDTDSSQTNSAVSDTVSNNSTKNKNKNANKNTNAEITDNANTANTNEENSNSDEEGLVEPDDSDNGSDNDDDNENINSSNENINEETDEAEGETETLYFAASAASCGDTIAVERKLELGDDPYGEILLSMMAGPQADDEGVDGIPSTVRLRQVEYTAAGPLITVGEGYDALTDCEKQTVDAQFIKTANAMFDLPEDTTGEVVVGTVESEDTETEEDSET